MQSTCISRGLYEETTQTGLTCCCQTRSCTPPRLQRPSRAQREQASSSVKYSKFTLFTFHQEVHLRLKAFHRGGEETTQTIHSSERTNCTTHSTHKCKLNITDLKMTFGRDFLMKHHMEIDAASTEGGCRRPSKRGGSWPFQSERPRQACPAVFPS